MARFGLAGLLGGCALTSGTPAASAQQSGDPLAPLTMAEHWAVLEVLSDAGRLTPDTRFGRVSLAPADKSDGWAGQSSARAAELVVKQGRDAIEATVDLSTRTVTRWDVVNGAHHPWLMEEYIGSVTRAALAHPAVKQALENRGIERPEFIQCRTSPPGNFSEPRFAGRRLAVVRCFPAGPAGNKYPRRVEGLLIFADMETSEILEVHDYETIPIPDTYAEYAGVDYPDDRSFPGDQIPGAPERDAFEIDGNDVTWDNWRFKIRSDQRVGIVISTASWKDDETWRPVLYEGHLSEISVPYQAPYGDWYLRNPIDAGEYSAGGLSDPLTAGVHCPVRAKFIDAIIVNDRGYPTAKNSVICMFEQASGDPTWLHDVEGRQDRSLVARMVARLGNYDYIVDWVFSQDGQIKVRLGATGIVAIRNTIELNAQTSPVTDEPADAYGRFVDEHVVAINHSHYFNFRFDLDVDGERNSFHRGDLVRRTMPAEHPRDSIWVMQDQILGTEAEGRLGGGGHNPAYWRVASSDQTNKNGYPTSYQIMGGMNAAPLISPEDAARSRAGFVDHKLWITAQKDAERFAAGDFPTLSEPGEGLPKYSSNEDISETDIVAWYTMGMHHVVRAEDWPVMPVLWHEVTLRPFDFFDANPGMSIAPTTPGGK